MREDLLKLQRTLADLVLEPDAGEAFDRDPEDFGARRGLAPRNTAALLRFKDRLLIYRQMVHSDLEDPLEESFPITRVALEAAEAWDRCVSDFISSRTVSTPHYRDIAPTFVGWLAESRWGLERWPWLLELAHFEFVDRMVRLGPDPDPRQDLDADPTPCHRIVLDGASQILSYRFAVHRSTEARPVPEETPAWLLAYRDTEEGDCRILEITEATSALLVRAQKEPIGEAVKILGLSDLQESLALLQDLQRQGAVRGFAGRESAASD